MHNQVSSCHRPLSGLMVAAVSLLGVGQAAGGFELLVTGFSSDSVARFDLATKAGLGVLTGGPGFDGPLCTRLGPDGLLYVASEGTDTIERYNPHTGVHVDTFITSGLGGLDGPTGVTWDSQGRLIVSSFNNDSVMRYNGSTGAFDRVLVAPGAGGLNGPDNGTIVGPDGLLYVPSYYSNRILRYDSDGVFQGAFGGLVPRPRVLEFHGTSLFVTSESTDTVKQYDAGTGAFIKNFVSIASGGGLDLPIGMVFGPDGYLYVASGSAGNVLRYNDQTGLFVDQYLAAGAGGTTTPVFLTIIPAPATTGLAALALVWTRRRRS